MIIFRWWYFVGITGLGLCGYGVIETGLSLRSSSEPIAVTIGDLETCKPLAQPYVRLGEHVALEPLGISHRAKRGTPRSCTPSSTRRTRSFAP